MTSISNITSGAPAPPVIAPTAASKVTIIDAKNASVIDSRGRLIKVKKLSALDRMRLFKAMGAVHAENRMAASYAATAAAVTELDGMMVPFPTSDIQLDALVGRLDEEGLEAVVMALVALTPAQEDIGAEAKGF
jgi:hypothetical protein